MLLVAARTGFRILDSVFIARRQRKGDSRREAPGGVPGSEEVIDRERKIILQL